jgi:glycine cleavage system transcriptional repressor
MLAAVRHFAISAIGRDRPGIVSAVTGALLEHGVNIEDSQSTILRGHFTMTLIVAAGDEVDPATLRADLERTASELALEAMTLSEVEDAEPARPAEPSHIVTVYGLDHPGIVHSVASALADCQVNITDLNTRLVGDPDHEDLYAMMLEIALPEGLAADRLESLLETTRREQGVEVTIRELERDAL